LNWGYAVIALLQGALFGRLGRTSFVPIPLAAICAATIVVYLASTISHVPYWWVAFLMNRLFELSLLYLIACALFRLIRLRMKRSRRRLGRRDAAPKRPGRAPLCAAPIAY
jgi:hypothetical protein